MFVLGIDPGLTTTGYAVVADRNGTTTALVAGVVRTATADSLAVRLAELHQDLSAVIAEHRPDAVAIEQVFTNRNLQTAVAVGRASGVAILAAAQAGLAVAEYTPSAVKAAVCGFGNAPKEQVQDMVKRRLGIDGDLAPDAADALALALCHVQSSAMRASVR